MKIIVEEPKFKPINIVLENEAEAGYLLSFILKNRDNITSPFQNHVVERLLGGLSKHVPYPTPIAK